MTKFNIEKLIFTLKTLSIITFSLASFAVERKESSQYTYDCYSSNNEYFHLTQNFEDGILINRNERMSLVDIELGETKFQNKYNYNNTLILSWSLISGSGSGAVFRVTDTTTSDFNCSLDWSPY